MDNKAGNTVSNANRVKFLTLSQRIARILVSIILIVVIATEALLPTLWLLVLLAVSVYSLVTGLLGWDPILKRLRQSKPLLPDQKLSLAAQLECAGFGAVCVAVGIVFRDSDSIFIRSLPFLGIYPILICAIKYDLLAHLLQSYRRSEATRDSE